MLMSHRDRGAGFTLIEVVIATGIFAVAVTTVVALLSALTRQSGASREALTAQHLPEAVQIELRRLTDGDFNGFAGSVPVMTAPLANGFSLVATREGNRLHAAAHPPPVAALQVPQAERYFLVELWRFNQPPLSYDGTAAFLAVHVRISWPYYNPGSPAPTPFTERNQFTFTASVNQ